MRLIPFGALETAGIRGSVREDDFTFTMRPFESTIQILLAASSLLIPSLAMAIMSR